MSKKKGLRFRAVCYTCNKAFDTRAVQIYFGHLICPECNEKLSKYRILDGDRQK